MPVWPQLQPYLFSLVHWIVALSIDHDNPLSVHLNLVFDTFSNEQRSPSRATDHPRWRLRSRRRKYFHILGPDRHIDRLADLDAIRVVVAPENDAVRRTLNGNGYLP